jgi:hypothetical protein
VLLPPGMPPSPGPLGWLLRRRLRRVLRLRDALQLRDLGERNLFLVARHRRISLQHHDPPHVAGHLPGTRTTTQPVPVLRIRDILVGSESGSMDPSLPLKLLLFSSVAVKGGKKIIYNI